MHDYPAILRVVLEQYLLPTDGLHGVGHWARVLENGLKMASQLKVDEEVISLFALFHDACRFNEDHDPKHGLRGAELAKSLRGDLIHLDDERFELLYAACVDHTNGLTVADPTIMVCWDADRLDLGRVGIVPNPKYLCTKVAKGMIHWSHLRAIDEYVPEAVLTAWGFEY